MEKTLDLKMPGVQELGKDELKKVDGGWIRLLIVYLAGLAQELVFEGFEQCKNDFNKGFDSTQNNN